MEYTTIKLAIYGNPQVEIEGVPNSGIRPGAICLQRNDSFYEQALGVAGESFEKLVAIEDLHLGNDIDYVYEPGGRVTLINLRPGDKFLGILEPAQTAKIGDTLELSTTNAGMLTVVVGATDPGLVIGKVCKSVISTIGSVYIEVSVI